MSPTYSESCNQIEQERGVNDNCKRCRGTITVTQLSLHWCPPKISIYHISVALCPLLNALSSVTDQTQTSDNAARACVQWALPLKNDLKAASPPLRNSHFGRARSRERAKSIVPKNFRASSRRVEFWHSALRSISIAQPRLLYCISSHAQRLCSLDS